MYAAVWTPRGVALRCCGLQVRVHVMRLRDLVPVTQTILHGNHGHSEFASVDACAFVDCLGAHTHSVVHAKVNNCIMDEVLSLRKKVERVDDLRAATVRVSVVDASKFGSRSRREVGVFSFDLCEVYARPKHEVWQQWVGLARPDEREIRGYALLSVTVLGPGDRAPSHTDTSFDYGGDDDDAKRGSDAMEGKDVLMPKHISAQVRWLVIDAYYAEHLPIFTAATMAGVYLKVKFAGQSKRTKTQPLPQNTFGSAYFGTSIWIPVMLPTLANLVEVELKLQDNMAVSYTARCRCLYSGISRSRPAFSRRRILCRTSASVSLR